jgi:hypothetical protein
VWQYGFAEFDLCFHLTEMEKSNKKQKKIKATDTTHSTSTSSTRPVESITASSNQPPEEVATAEVEEKECTICLDKVTKGGGIDSCIHIFCFECILKWSKVTNKCPVCSQKFKNITELTATDDKLLEADHINSKGSKKRQRKPKTVKVANKEQKVSYEYTGTFGNTYDESDDSWDSDFEPMDEDELQTFHYYGNVCVAVLHRSH